MVNAAALADSSDDESEDDDVEPVVVMLRQSLRRDGLAGMVASEAAAQRA